MAVFGFRLRIADAALPILGIGAFLWLVAKGKVRSFGAVLAGFGLLFTGIAYMQTGMEDVTWNFTAFTGPGSQWVLAGIGVIMTIVMQSSSAAAATTLVALNAGSLTFDQGCAMIVGQSVGTTATTALMMLGGGLAVRRAALAHILFSLIVGGLAMIFIGPLAAAADWIGARLDDPDGVLALAAFSSIFKFAGVAVFFPLIDRFARLIERLSGAGSESAISRLDPAVAEAGGAIALEAAWRAINEVAQGAVAAVRATLANQPVKYTPPPDAIRQVDHFLESLSMETTDQATIGPRLVRLCHALDHLTQLHDDLTRVPSSASETQWPAGFQAGVQALDDWLAASVDVAETTDPSVFAALEDASKRVSVECSARRAQTLEEIAQKRMPTATARGVLDTLAWSDRALYHAWRLAESLRVASGG